ncbi:MAG: hypothetical protein IT569_07580 [Leptospiraceae bacterium]|nr:hypothetical protein [Leptospiraceae bacterium]
MKEIITKHLKAYFILFVYVIMLFPLFSQSKEKVWHYEKLTIRENPEQRPKAIQKEFIPDGGNLLYSTEFRGSFGDSVESVVIYGHSLDLKSLNLFYDLIFKNLEWKVLQKELLEKKSVYLAEGPSRRMITILLSDESDKRIIKIFLKKATLF